jgi:hypothetical protein
VRIEKAEPEDEHTEPRFEPQKLFKGVPEPVPEVRYGEEWSR